MANLICENTQNNEINLYDIYSNRLDEYLESLYEDNRSKQTVATYCCCLKKVIAYAKRYSNCTMNKSMLMQYKQHLEANYKIGSVNNYINSINKYLNYLGLDYYCLEYVRVQQVPSIENVLEKREYDFWIESLIRMANPTTYLIIRTLASTGIRVGELKFVTAETLEAGGVAIVKNKRKVREIFIPEHVLILLQAYCKERGISSGPVFRAKNGQNGLHPSSIWRRIQTSAIKYGIDKEKAHPHNFRHIFAKTYLDKTGDLASLADVLGHESINTTRIYTRESKNERRKRINALEL